MSAQPSSFDDTPQRALASARPALEELLSLWPSERRSQLVLWVSCGSDGQLAVGARQRDQDPISRGAGAVAVAIRRTRGIPVVLELGHGRTSVLPFIGS